MIFFVGIGLLNYTENHAERTPWRFDSAPQLQGDTSDVSGPSLKSTSVTAENKARLAAGKDRPILPDNGGL